MMESWREPYIHIKTCESKCRYQADDGKIFNDELQYHVHQLRLYLAKQKWIRKRYSLRGRIKFFFTGYQPGKPYNF